MLALVNHPEAGPSINATEAATLQLRERALRTPGIMPHSRAQPPYAMMQEAFKQDPVFKMAFPTLPRLSLLGTATCH